MNFNAFKNPDIKTVIAGISGGADSVAMLRAYLECEVKVFGVHCNFGLRGNESDRDQNFVENLCRSLDVPLIIYKPDVANFISQNKVSIEMACRELRYAKFRELKEKYKADRIAVAHNADDNIETFFLNLMRGSGIAGLRGMLPDTGEIVRPLLEVYRFEILKYLDSLNQSFVIDSTNLKCDFRRNFIRNRIIPLLETEWKETKKSVSKSISYLRQDETILEYEVEKFIRNKKNILEYEKIKKFIEPRWLIYKFINQYGGSHSQSEEIYRCISNKNFESGKYWLVKGGEIHAERSFLEFVEEKKTKFEVICSKYKVSEEILTQIRHASLSVLWTDLTEDRILFRTAREGDRIKPLGMKGSVLISKIMKDSKLSFSEKERIVVAEEISTGEIIWINGLKRSRLHLLTSSDSEAYKYEIIGC